MAPISTLARIGKRNDDNDIVRDTQICRLVWSKTIAIEDQVLNLYREVQARDPHDTEFLQAVSEVVHSCMPVFKKDPKYICVMKQIIEPERVIMFRVPWIDDNGVQQINRGYRVQFSSALGPYKGGIRFHPTVNLSVMKFLGFEQIFKNALTGTGIGGAKGGANFDPKGKSDNEILRFCQSFMTSLSEYIGPSVDVPAGDIGVGKTEIGYMYGQYKKLTHSFDSSLTGKGLEYGGSNARPEATGYGSVYFLQNYLERHPELSLKNAPCVVSGSGNVAQYAAQLLVQLGAKVITVSDSSGYILEPQGFTSTQIDHIMHMKNVEKHRIEHYCKFSKTAKFIPNKRPWEVENYLVAFPCATQNEIQKADAQNIINAKCKVVVEGANMPTDAEAADLFKANGVTLCPAKAANAGGVAVSALEMAQNWTRCQWSREEVIEKLKRIMKNIYDACESSATRYDCPGDLVAGANISGFLKVADAVIQQGTV